MWHVRGHEVDNEGSWELVLGYSLQLTFVCFLAVMLKNAISRTKHSTLLLNILLIFYPTTIFYNE